MSFRIIAIQPHTKCDPDLRKVLKEETIYYFFNNYEIDHKQIKVLPSTVPEDLFHLTKARAVNISAVVGKNGSGKSSLMDVLYAVLFVYSWRYKLLPESAKTNVSDINKMKVYASLYFEDQVGNFTRIECKGSTVELFRQKGRTGKLRIIDKTRPDLVAPIFYTIVSNYSIFSFLPSGNYPWLAKIFAKNDGYQLPLVINPFRDRGIINISSEEHLIRSRLLTNLLATGERGEPLYNELAPGKMVDAIKLTYRRDKMTFKGLPPGVTKILRENHRIIQDILFTKLFKIPFPLADSARNIEGAVKYVIQKLYKITCNYAPFQNKSCRFIILVHHKTLGELDKRKSPPSTSYRFGADELINLLDKIKQLPSHITFKLNQTVNFIRHFNFYDKLTKNYTSFEELRPAIGEMAESTGKHMIDLVPPPIFKTEIRFKDRGILNFLSSGEKQRIYSSTSWMYHLINLLSVREDKASNYRRYNTINIVFDEIELYYHPEMQRNFVKDFLQMLERLPLTQQTAINCIFITHSPFILSDIPNENILYLSPNGQPETPIEDARTFGANIHELLQKSFFLENGTMGALAQERITELINYLQDNKNPRNWTSEIALQYIQLVSEPIIRARLLELYRDKFTTDMHLQQQISALQSILDKRKQQPDDLN